MNKIILAAAAVLVAACAPKTLEEKTQEYQDKCDAIIEAMQNDFDTVAADSTLTDAQKAERYSQIEDKACEDIVKVSSKTLSRNADNALGIEALKSVYYLVSPEQLNGLIAKLSDENKQDEFVQKLLKNLDAKMATAEGKMFTDFEIVQYPDAEDKGTVKLSDYVGKGKYILVDFWASWCGPCKKEIPNIKSVYEKYAGENFDVLSVAVWDDPQASVDTAAAYGVNWAEIVNAQKIPSDLYGIEGIPHIILFGPDGTILKRDLRGSSIEKEVAACLGR